MPASNKHTTQDGARETRANLGLEKLRFLFRVAHDLRHLDQRRYEFAARSIGVRARL